MPSSITVGSVGGVSLTTRRPGTIGNPSAASVGGRSLTTNVFAVVGEFPWLKAATPTRFNGSDDLLNGAPPETKLASDIARFAYEQKDPKVNGQPSAVFLVNTAPNTNSQLTLLDAGGNDAIKLTSKFYGLDANQTLVSVAANAIDATKRDITLTFKGRSEVFTVGTGALATFAYTGTDATAVVLNVRSSSPTSADVFKITQSRAGLSGGFVPSEGTWLWDGVLTVTPSAAPTEDATLLVTGILKTGVASTETLTIPSGDGSAVIGTKEWNAITALAYTASTGAETATVSGDALQVGDTAGNLGSFSHLGAVADYLNQFSAQGWVATKAAPNIRNTPLLSVDKVAAGDMVAAAVGVTADTWHAVRTIGTQSILVDAEQLVTGEGQTVALATTQLAGGTVTTATASDLSAALVECRKESIQVYTLLHTDQASQEALRTHIQYMAGLGSGECNGWVAMPSLPTFTEFKDRAKALNTRHLALVGQDFIAFNAEGATTQYEPATLAIIMGAMQASTPLSTPLTRKHPLINSFITHSSWDADTDADEALENGLCIVTTGPLGPRTERSVTTYLLDDNPIFSEVSANESFYTSIRDLRSFLDADVGDANFIFSAKLLQARCKVRLMEQVEEGIIKAFDEDSLKVKDRGDYFEVVYRVAPIEPTNWIVVSASAARTPFANAA